MERGCQEIFLDFFKKIAYFMNIIKFTLNYHVYKNFDFLRKNKNFKNFVFLKGVGKGRMLRARVSEFLIFC
jgi:hypothetical protein